MIRIAVLLSALLFSLSALAAEAAATGVLTREPAVIESAEPEYPTDAQMAGLAAEVVLELEVSETGAVANATVTQPAGHGFDESALAAARTLRFSPAEIDGKPAAVRLEYRFRFEVKAAAAPEVSTAVNLRGLVLERGTRRPVVGAAVDAGGQTTHTDKEGRFELAGVPLGTVKVTVFDTDYQQYQVEETVEAGQTTEVKYWLQKKTTGPYETVVVGEREKREVSRVAISAGEISRVTGVSGDAVKVILNLPGVARTTMGMGPPVIRGGNPRDTRVYIDDLEVPLIFHFAGLTSVYSSDLVKEVEFEAGNFGVKSGRATGGRVNLVTRDPGDQTHLVADVNLYHATALAEFHLSDQLSLALSGRRSYADIFMNAMQSGGDGGSYSVAPRYYDFQAKLTWTPTPDDKVRLHAFGSDDKMVLIGGDKNSLRRHDEINYGTSFYQLAASWDHRFDAATRAHLVLGQGWTRADMKVGSFRSESDRFITTSSRAAIYREFGPFLELGAGFDGWYRPTLQIDVLAPATTRPCQLESSDTQGQQRLSVNQHETQAAGWLEAKLSPLDRLTIVPGIRYDVFRSLSNLSWMDPRLNARLAVGSATTLKGGVGLYHQPPPYAYLTQQWGNPALKPEGSYQYSVGVEQRIASRLFLDVQLYYKRLFDLALPTDAMTSRGGRLVPLNYVSEGTGKAYGGELLLRWEPGGRFFGWIAYSFSRSLRDQTRIREPSEPEDASAYANAEGDAYDQPHNLIVVGTCELPEIWDGLSAGFRLRFTSGSPYERIRGAIYDGSTDSYQPIQTGRTNDRMPPFFQLDLRIDKKWTYHTWNLSAYLEIQNVTLHQNPEFVTYNYDYSKIGFINGFPIFPSFGLRVEY